MSLKVTTKPRVSTKISPYKYAWIQEPNGHYTLRVDQKFLARVYENDGKWRLVVVTGGKTYRGERESLEAAEKSVDRALYKNFPHVWTVLDARVIIAPWKGRLDL